MPSSSSPYIELDSNSKSSLEVPLLSDLAKIFALIFFSAKFALSGEFARFHLRCSMFSFLDSDENSSYVCDSNTRKVITDTEKDFWVLPYISVEDLLHVQIV